MAYASDIRLPLPGLRARIDAVLDTFVRVRAQRKVYKRTLNELRQLDSRALADIGLSASQVRAIAYETAYGRA